MLTAELSQDSLESFFGKQRMRDGYSDNPNFATFLHGAQLLRVQLLSQPMETANEDEPMNLLL